MRSLLVLAQENAGHGEGHGAEHAEVLAFNWLPAVTTLVVFLVAFGFLYFQVWPKIVKGLDDRQHKIRREIEAAEEARRAARAALEEYESNLARARQEAATMIARAKAEAQARGEELKARNEADLAEQRRRAAREIEGAKRAAIAELHENAVTLAAAMSSRILRREITPADQQRLLDESLGELARSAE